MKGWLCPLCVKYKETFNHIWTCDRNVENIKTIFELSIEKLFDLIKEFKKDVLCDQMDDIRNFYFFKISNITTNHLNYIDIIKGIVPKILVEAVDRYIKNSQITRSIISNFLHILFTNIYENIWKKRIEIANYFELQLGISKKMKKDKKYYKNDNNYSTEDYENKKETNIANNREIENLVRIRVVKHILFAEKISFNF